MSRVAGAINTAWMLSCRGERGRFQRAIHRVEATQREVLAAILAADATTAFGRGHGLLPATSYEEFAERVPISGYDGHAAYIDRVAAGEDHVLTADPVPLLQPTSGSTGGRKLIPFTATSRRLLQRTISAWIGDLFAARPAVRRGRAYWSISPAFAPEAPTSGGTRVGFADDTEYLSGPERLAVRRVLAVPPEVIDAPSITEFRRLTLAHLLTTPDLALISIWSPTFLLALLRELDESPGAVLRLAATLDPERARRATRILGSGVDRAEQLRELWPALALLSCWTDGSAAGHLPALTELLTGVEVQPKGLLATEAFVSFPLADRPGAALALRSHFFEFLPVRAADGHESEPRLAAELEVGGRYKPVVTTGGGLYRYLLDDVIEVVGHEHGCPLLRFRGRAGTSDLVGEKLDESFVAGTLAGLDREALLVADAETSSYHLLVGAPGPDSNDHRAAAVDRALRANPHYDYARRLGQLGPVRTSDVGEPVWAFYERAMVARGVRLGDIKPACLVTSPTLAATLTSQAEEIAVRR